jgi:alkylated DNA nucleotide flippase Atl1
MNNCPEHVPWWRVVASTGHLPIGKRAIELERMQEEMLRSEGVEVRDGKIDMERFGCDVLEEIAAEDGQMGH